MSFSRASGVRTRLDGDLSREAGVEAATAAGIVREDAEPADAALEVDAAVAAKAGAD